MILIPSHDPIDVVVELTLHIHVNEVLRSRYYGVKVVTNFTTQKTHIKEFWVACALYCDKSSENIGVAWQSETQELINAIRNVG